MSSRTHNEDEEDDEPESKQFKVILLGDGTVGKTSISLRFTSDQFTNQYKQTIGVDFFLKRLILPGEVKTTLQVWDIGGQTIGGKMIRNYIFGAHAVLFVYDITNYDSFQNLEDWYRLVQQTFAKTSLPYLGLIGNKNDLAHIRAVSQDLHNAFADENGMHGFVISAKSGHQVARTFAQIAGDLAGVPMARHDLQARTEVIPALIVNHKQHDPRINEGKLPEYTKQGVACSVS